MSTQIKTLAQLEEYKNTHETVLLKFSAGWCAPCRVLDARITDIENVLEKDGKRDVTAILTVDVEDADEELVSSFSVTALPTCIIFRKNHTVSMERLIGIVSFNTLFKKLTGE